MGASQPNDPHWILCPKCRIANFSTSVTCGSCGAVLEPNAPPPPHPSGASPKQWMLFIGILGLLIGSALWAAFSPSSIAAKMYRESRLIVYALALIYGFGRSILCVRKRDFSGGILQCALTILFALAALPAVLDIDR